MGPMDKSPFTPRRLILALLLGGLLVLAYSVLHLFLVPIAWAAIMAYATWPMYVRLRRALGGPSLFVADLAARYGFTDADGTRPARFRVPASASS